MIERHDYTPAALYARVSSDRQDVDLSVAAQLRALRDHAQKNGYIVVREYVDEAESGRIADRPEFRKMIDAASQTNAPFQEIFHSTDTIDTENSGTRGRPIWVHSSQVGKAHSKWVCHVVPAYPNVSPGPMNGSIPSRH